MRRLPRAVVLLVGTLALTSCSSDSSTEPTEPEPEEEEEVIPTVGTADRASIPDYPESLEVKVSCHTSSDGGASEDCPVLLWGDYTYWALSHNDNSGAMTILAFDAEGELAGTWERSGARYLWQITIDEDAETVSFWGQATGVIEVGWDELEL